MIALPSFLTGNLWKLATGGAAIVGLVLSALLMSSYFENRDLMKQRTALQTSINDPVTGYVARLAQANTNVATLKHEVEVQNDAYDRLSAESKALLASKQAELAKAQAQTKAMQLRLNGFLATKPQGATLEDRVRDIDARGMAEMVQ